MRRAKYGEKRRIAETKEGERKGPLEKKKGGRGRETSKSADEREGAGERKTQNVGKKKQKGGMRSRGKGEERAVEKGGPIAGNGKCRPISLKNGCLFAGDML